MQTDIQRLFLCACWFTGQRLKTPIYDITIMQFKYSVKEIKLHIFDLHHLLLWPIYLGGKLPMATLKRNSNGL